MKMSIVSVVDRLRVIHASSYTPGTRNRVFSRPVERIKAFQAPKSHSGISLPELRFEFGLECMLGNIICVVDDDTYVLRSLKEVLASDDIEAETFNNPQTFLDQSTCAGRGKATNLRASIPIREAVVAALSGQANQEQDPRTEELPDWDGADRWKQ
jgi:hypothetical protein